MEFYLDRIQINYINYQNINKSQQIKLFSTESVNITNKFSVPTLTTAFLEDLSLSRNSRRLHLGRSLISDHLAIIRHSELISCLLLEGPYGKRRSCRRSTLNSISRLREMSEHSGRPIDLWTVTKPRTLFLLTASG